MINGIVLFKNIFLNALQKLILMVIVFRNILLLLLLQNLYIKSYWKIEIYAIINENLICAWLQMFCI